MSAYSLVALVPMRHHSVRVPGKNYRELSGRPLYSYILDTLQEVEGIEAIIVDTDSPVLREGINHRYPQVQLIDRPEHLTADTTPMNEILLNDVGQVESEIYLQTHSTNPLLRPETIRAAVREFRDNFQKSDSLFSVTRLHTRLWDADTTPINHDPSVLLRTQDLEPVFEENSCLYLFTRETILDTGRRIGRSPAMFEVSWPEALDIDDEADFELAFALLANR